MYPDLRGLFCKVYTKLEKKQLLFKVDSLTLILINPVETLPLKQRLSLIKISKDVNELVITSRSFTFFVCFQFFLGKFTCFALIFLFSTF